MTGYDYINRSPDMVTGDCSGPCRFPSGFILAVILFVSHDNVSGNSDTIVY